MNTVEGHSNVTPTTIMPFTSTLTHVSICAHHTYAWRGNVYDINDIFKDWRSLVHQRWLSAPFPDFPMVALPGGCTHPMLPFLSAQSHTHSPCSTQLSRGKMDRVPGCFPAFPLPATQLFVSLHHHLSLNCFSSHLWKQQLIRKWSETKWAIERNCTKLHSS